ncbi:PTS N-acetylgalactosamine transporter subunit IIC [Virgibacillus pantothenticus]|uniref:PTS system N-acetylgalactosamine-specific transporter subunit IIC n=1 Tax=Virgibacillus pantothenticus TaxID=1473 RepID=A0A0L0QTU1_VIRPA|nr:MULTISPECIES: PTS N-acetylgalactosamine transporter subunit IIC [Virgibacillus]API91733.1 PTS N-acetylgalactosamine transporter subunit IIC [Virgibacillus sp. 6R]KNE21623.1 PTS system N-acetylgalactosamine-specific transporter subunit IIC [Virgibacillus pantothenticus]MBS7427851.1 PTS sugar transporter subunit IIC [Virgibacillus sp. 19R1-5]MBU8566643.1 PTS sugar transporter subunit IIC [Virgibacillus pantothenticus]MBU8599134.1 PTS sugar transporter subunit IIC [Virgibacillus pantothenticus
MVMEAILIAIWAGIIGIDLYVGLTHMHRPVVTGLVVGLILGDVTTGLIVGGTLELIWMGMVPLAGAQPPNVVIGGVIGTAFGVIAGQDPQVAVGVAIPFAVAVQGLITLFFTIFAPVMHKADQYALDANTKGIERINYLGIAILFSFNALIAFLPIYFGAEQAAAFVETVPQWIIDGLSIAGGIMPAIGFAMLLRIMMKVEYIMFFIVGFILAAYLELPILAIALIGLAIALYDFYQNKNKQGPTPKEEEIADGI